MVTFAYAHLSDNNIPGGGETKDICYYCKANVAKLYGVLNNTKTQDAIIAGAGMFCQVLQPPLKEQCSQAVATAKSAGQFLWGIVLGYLQNPAEACAMM